MSGPGEQQETRPLSTAALAPELTHLSPGTLLPISDGSCDGDTSLRGPSTVQTWTLRQALEHLPDSQEWGQVTALQGVRLFAELVNHVEEEQLAQLCEETNMTREELEAQIGHVLELWEALKLAMIPGRNLVKDLILHTAEEHISGVRGTLKLPEDWRD